MRTLLLAGMSLLGGCTHATTPVAISCPERSGFLDGPFVENEVTARAIAEAIIGSIENRNSDDEYVLKVVDSGSHWDAFQSLRVNEDLNPEGDMLIVTAGGGGVEMRIAKCDGAVSEVHFIR